MSTLPIRQFGDPVLTTATTEVAEIDDRIRTLVDHMLETMYAAPGVGLAANQVGVSKRLFVYDHGDGPVVVINPVLEASEGSWTGDEGCLSVAGLNWEITRAERVRMSGIDLNGDPLSLEGEGYVAKILQHEFDHLNGMLLLERITDEERREAKRFLLARAAEDPAGAPTDARA